MKAGGRNPVDISQGEKKAKSGEGADGKSPERERTRPVAIPRTAAGFLERIALGDSIKGACAAVGVTVSAYQKWRDRFDGYSEAVEAARAEHQQWVRCGLMEDDAFAMQLLSRIMRDENQPVLRRQRAATQILNRKGKRDWVPDAIPAGGEPLRPWGGFVEVDERAEGADAKTGSGVRDPGSGGKSAEPACGDASVLVGTAPVDGDGVSSAPVSSATDASPMDAPSGDASPEAAPGDGRSDVPHLSPDPGARTPDPDPAAARRDAESAAARRDADPTASSSDAAAPPPPKPRRRETVLTDQFLSATFLHKHEPREAFERLLRNQMRAYAPATPQEELLAFRVTQKAWVLRRLDTFDRVIADSAVTKVRDKHPNAAPAACIAMTYLTRGDTEETRFHERIAKLRREHEAMHDRLESKLHTLQERRIAREDRHRGGPALSVHAQGGLSGGKVVEMTPNMGWEAVAG
jgi:hypothetical protein